MSEPSFAQIDPAFGLINLFRPNLRGKRAKRLEFTQVFDKVELKVTCFEELDSADQSILLALSALAGIGGKNLPAGSGKESAKLLWANLSCTYSSTVKGGDKTDEWPVAVVVTTTRREILRAAGLAIGGNPYKALKSSLERLSSVGCHVTRQVKEGEEAWNMQLLSYFLRADGRVHVALNPRFALALAPAAQNVSVSLEERRQLNSNVAKVLHAWLSAVTRPGSSGISMGADTLAAKVWGEEAKSDAIARKRRALIIAAVSTMEGKDVGWKFEVTGRGKGLKFRPRRPALPAGAKME